MAELITAGKGLTVTVIVSAAPAHDPPVDTGVITYSTEPAVVLSGLVKAWLIEEPELASAPLILPVLVPIVQLKLLAVVAANVIAGPVPLQILAVDAFVKTGIGFTVTVIV